MAKVVGMSRTIATACFRNRGGRGFVLRVSVLESPVRAYILAASKGLNSSRSWLGETSFRSIKAIGAGERQRLAREHQLMQRFAAGRKAAS